MSFTRAGFTLALLLLPLLPASAGFADAKAPPPFEIYTGLESKRVNSSSRVTKAKSRHVLGPVLQGDVVHHTFRIENGGSEPLELRDVTVCSGCIPGGHSKEIAPGSEGSISILVTTDWLGGRTIESPIVAETSSPEMPRLEIEVVLEVREFAALEPYRVWLKGAVSEPVTATCLVTPNEDYPFSITGIKTRKGVWFEHSWEAIERDGRRAFEITLVNTRDKPGPYQDVLFVQTDHPERPEFKIRVEGRIEE